MNGNEAEEQQLAVNILKYNETVGKVEMLPVPGNAEQNVQPSDVVENSGMSVEHEDIRHNVESGDALGIVELWTESDETTVGSNDALRSEQMPVIRGDVEINVQNRESDGNGESLDSAVEDCLQEIEVVDEHGYASDAVQIIIHQELTDISFDNTVEVDDVYETENINPNDQSDNNNTDRLNQILSYEMGRDTNPLQADVDVAEQTSGMIGIEDVQGIDVICGNCGEHFHSLSTLSSHLSARHGSVLNATTTSVEIIQDEPSPNETHDLPMNDFISPKLEKYNCYLCSKEFFSKRTLLRHSRTCAETTDFNKVKMSQTMNDITEDKVASVPLSEIPISSLTCNLCSKIFSSQSSLQDHMQAKHKMEVAENSDMDSDEDFEISDSGSDYEISDESTKNSSKSAFLKIAIGHQSHRKHQTNTEKFGEYDDYGDGNTLCESQFPIRARTCKYCGKVLSSPRNMRRHIKKIHENTLKRHPQSDQLRYKRERQMKTLETPFPTQQNGELNLHTDDYALKRELDNEMAIVPDDDDDDDSHFPLQSRTCKYCAKVLSRPTNMRKHVRKVHGNLSEGQQCAETEPSSTQQKDESLNPFPSERHKRIVSGQRPVIKKMTDDHETVVVITNNKDTTKTGYNKRIVQCSECCKMLSSQHSLMEHMRTHTGEKPFQCDKCGRPFSTPRNLKKHMVSVHSGMKAFKCNDCDKEFALKSSLKAHSKFHTGTFRYHCAGCGKGFQTPASLRRHEMIHTGERPYPCEQCGKRFNDMSALKKHCFFHTGLKPHVCEKCGHSFATLSSLRYHDLVHTGVSAFNCNECGKNYRTNASLQRHQRIHSGEKPYVCDFCGEGFGERWQLVAHHREHTGEKPYTCSHCDKAFATLRKLTRHTHIHNPSHLCTYCGKSFTTSSFLKTHMYKHTGQHPYPCPQCPKRFATRSSLKRHEVTHSGLKPFVCDFCGKCFSSGIGLKNHTTLHTGDRPYICAACGKGFPNKTALRIHSLFHNAERQYHCDLCPRKFHRIYELNHHRLIHNEEKLFKCDHCDKAYHHRSQLTAHINTHTEEKWYACNECDKSFLREATLRKHRIIHLAIKPHPCSECGKRFVRKEHLRRHLMTHTGVVSKVAAPVADEVVEFKDALADENIMNLEDSSIVAEHVEMDLEDDD